MALADCQPQKLGIQNGVAAEDAKAGSWCVGSTGWCNGQDWKNTRHACRVMHRELLLVPDTVQGVTPMECIWGPNVISAYIIDQHLLVMDRVGCAK